MRENDIFQALEKHLEIQFIDEDSTLANESSDPAQLTSDDLAMLPKIWLLKFQQAIIESKVKEIETLVK